MVLGGESQVLDLGRELRLYTRYQPIALAHQYGGCTAEGCDAPPAWCEIDHEWAGNTQNRDLPRVAV